MLQMKSTCCACFLWLFVEKLQKSTLPEIYRIDTKNGHYLEGVHLFQTIILGIHVSFRGCIIWKKHSTTLVLVWPPAHPKKTPHSRSLTASLPLKNDGFWTTTACLLGFVSATFQGKKDSLSNFRWAKKKSKVLWCVCPAWPKKSLKLTRSKCRKTGPPVAVAREVAVVSSDWMHLIKVASKSLENEKNY